MFNLFEYKKRAQSIADYLPWAALVAPGIILNKDGSFQRTAKFRGPDLESSTEEGLVVICARFNDVVKRFGSGWALFFEAKRHGVEGYPQSNFTDPASWVVDEERRGAFEEEGRHFETAYYLTFTYFPPEDRAQRAEGLILETPDGKRSFNHWDHLARFAMLTDRALDLLSGIMPEVKALDDVQTLTYLHATISPKRHPVTLPDVPMYLDGVLADSALNGGLEPMLGDHHLRVLTVLGFPGATTPGLLDGLNHLGIEYRWMTRFIPLDKTIATGQLTKYRRQWFSKRKSIGAILKEVMTNEASVLVDTDADNKAADADEALQELGADYVSYGYHTASVVVWDRNLSEVGEKVRAIERVINGAGFVTINETVNAIDAWLGSLPGHVYANVRQPLVSSLNLTHMIPLSAVWAGPERNEHLQGPPLLLAETSGETPFRLVTHVGDVGHTLVVGPTGAGKSVLLSLLAMQFRRYPNAQVYLFDKGGSARAATLAMRGDYYELGTNEALAFQPLAEIDNDRERAWAADWIAGLLSNQSIQITPDIRESLWSALTNLATAPKTERTLTGLAVLLQDNKLKQALHPFTLEGPLGRLLDADEDRLKMGTVQCFEMEQLMHEQSAVLPVLTYLFHKLEARFDGKPSLLILDEAWIFLDDETFAGRIREWLKVLRKKNVSVIFATQSLADIVTSSIAPAIIESCPSRIFLPNERAIEPEAQAIYERFGLNARQIEIIARATPKRDYYYQSRRGNRLFDLALGPVALAFCAASSKEDHALITRILASHSLAEFPAAYLKARGLDWAADLIKGEKL